MKKKYFLFLMLLLLCCDFLFFCKKKQDEPAILVTPSTLHLNVNPSEVLVFNIKVKTETALNLFRVSYKMDTTYEIKIFDSTLNNLMNFSTTYYFKVPSNWRGLSVMLYFRIFDVNGKSDVSFTTLHVSGSIQYLTETTGHIIFSKYSGKTDGFDINTALPQFSALANDSLLDIADYDTVSTGYSLSNSWYSPAGNKFVLFNGFDYANATNNTAEAAYQSGLKLDIISGIKVNDIIITKYIKNSHDAYAVIKITDIFDSDSTDNDSYIFYLKK